MDSDYASTLFAPTAEHLAPPSAAQRVYEHLRQRIVSMELLPGAALSRNELAREYGVSQTPIRDAMQRLEQDGLLRIYPQSRTVVSQIDVNQLHETQFLRVALETEVVRRLAERPSKPHLDRARTLLRMQEAIADDPDQFPMFNNLDRAFHRTLFEAVNAPNLYQHMASRSGHLARCQRLDLERSGKTRMILDGHRAILEAIGSGDPDAAAQALRYHVSDTILRIESLRDAHPDYFSGL